MSNEGRGRKPPVVVPGACSWRKVMVVSAMMLIIVTAFAFVESKVERNWTIRCLRRGVW
jgi:hypothetical protein